MASFSCLWICHWFIMISFGSIVLLLYYWILLVDCGQWLRRLICSSVFCYGYITGSWWTMLGCCYADTQGCSWGHHLCKTHELPNILRWGNMFSITRGLEVYCWLFFSWGKKALVTLLPWIGYFSASGHINLLTSRGTAQAEDPRSSKGTSIFGKPFPGNHGILGGS